MPEPKQLRNLRILVTVLTASMVIGITAIFLLIGFKITQPSTPELALPEVIELPDGETAQAVTQGLNWIGVVTIDGEGQERIHILEVDGTPRQTVILAP